jgi:hypothetical protein
MGNACTNCSACKGDMGENSEVLTVDNKVSISLEELIRDSTNLLYSMAPRYRKRDW